MEVHSSTMTWLLRNGIQINSINEDEIFINDKTTSNKEDESPSNDETNSDKDEEFSSNDEFDSFDDM
jgi:hypothetical protein